MFLVLAGDAHPLSEESAVAKDRISKRVAFRNTVYYGPTDPPEHISFITDLSETGLCIQTNRVFTPGTKIYLVIETSGRRFRAEGVVIWAKKVPPNFIQLVKNGMGIKFTRVDKELLDAYRKKTPETST